jgi:VirE-like protein
MNGPRLSAVNHATDTATRDYDATVVVEAVRTGGKGLRGQVEGIRVRLQHELAAHGNYKRAKQATSELKRQLPAVLWSGTFTQRANDKLVQHSGLLCADLDSLNGELAEVRGSLLKSPHVWALFRSPSGDGLKVVFRVSADATKHAASYRAVERYVCELTGKQIDQSGKDLARLCFLSYDGDIYHNPNATEITPVPESDKLQRVSNGEVNLSERQGIATTLLGEIDWQSETSGFVACPGRHLHTSGDNVRDCKIDFDGVPTVHCFHNSCRGILDGINHELRSQIGKAEYNGKRETPEGRPKENSFNSFNHRADGGTDDFPEPPSELAFHGLAGDIVRRIEPKPTRLLCSFKRCWHTGTR